MILLASSGITLSNIYTFDKNIKRGQECANTCPNVINYKNYE